MFALNQWNPWTEASAGVDYDFAPNGVGRGEHKVAAELNATVHGQNESYDMDVVINGIQCRGEVKELDLDGSFRCGKNVRDAYRPSMARIMALLALFDTIKEDALIPDGLRPDLRRLAVISPDEISQGNLRRLEKVCADLSLFRQGLQGALPEVSSFDPITGQPRVVAADTFYRTALAAGASADVLRETLGPVAYEAVVMVCRLSHEYITTPGKLTEELQSVRNVFRGYVLVFVHPNRGYYVMDVPEEKIRVYRVTSTAPRFRAPV